MEDWKKARCHPLHQSLYPSIPQSTLPICHEHQLWREAASGTSGLMGLWIDGVLEKGSLPPLPSIHLSMDPSIHPSVLPVSLLAKVETLPPECVREFPREDHRS